MDVIVSDSDKDLILITNFGMTMRMLINQISILGRNTQGVRLMHLKDNQQISTISLVDHESEEGAEETNIETNENVEDTPNNEKSE